MRACVRACLRARVCMNARFLCDPMCVLYIYMCVCMCVHYLGVCVCVVEFVLR